MRRRLFALPALLVSLAWPAASSADDTASTTPAPAFDSAQYVRYSKNGKSRIDGTFVLRVGSGDPKPQSGATVECYPDLPYTEWALAQTANAINKSSDTTTAGAPSAEDPRLEPYARTTKTDSNGNFHFYRLPYGRYVMRASLITAFPRVVHNQVQGGAVYSGPNVVGGPGQTVYDYSRAYFDSNPVYAGPRPPFPPVFHLVARHNTFDPRR
jgi:hypothetical protein